jgi:hypothetical protein
MTDLFADARVQRIADIMQHYLDLGWDARLVAEKIDEVHDEPLQVARDGSFVRWEPPHRYAPIVALRDRTGIDSDPTS